MGAHFRLALSERRIARLRVPAWKRAVLRAMARYGMFVGDVGGVQFGMLESGSTYTSFGREDAMVTYARDAGVPRHGDHYLFDIGSGIRWERLLRVVDPCVARRSCR
jgi:hypothetical protein